MKFDGEDGGASPHLALVGCAIGYLITAEKRYSCPKIFKNEICVFFTCQDSKNHFYSSLIQKCELVSDSSQKKESFDKQSLKATQNLKTESQKSFNMKENVESWAKSFIQKVKS